MLVQVCGLNLKSYQHYFARHQIDNFQGSKMKIFHTYLMEPIQILNTACYIPLSCYCGQYDRMLRNLFTSFKKKNLSTILNKGYRFMLAYVFRLNQNLFLSYSRRPHQVVFFFFFFKKKKKKSKRPWDLNMVLNT